MYDTDLVNRPFNVGTGRGVVANHVPPPASSPTFIELLPKFMRHATVHWGLAGGTLKKYKECMGWIIKLLPHVPGPAALCRDDITLLKELIQNRGAGEARANSFIFTLRKFLQYCQKEQGIKVLGLEFVKPARLPKRQVIFLTEEEMEKFVGSIDHEDSRGLRMRALCEFLFGTALRISEVLSLNRADIDWERQQSKTIGKGNKEITFFITDRAKEWVKRYLANRVDDSPALFVTFAAEPVRLKQFDMPKLFQRYKAKAGITKKLTPHILRHTAATLMLKNGCPLTYIQQMLHHESVETTARYYLGTDTQSLKEAHAKYLKY